MQTKQEVIFKSKRLFLVRKKGAPAKRLRVLKVGECLGPTTERNILNRLYKFNIPEKVGYYLSVVAVETS